MCLPDVRTTTIENQHSTNATKCTSDCSNTKRLNSSTKRPASDLRSTQSPSDLRSTYKESKSNAKCLDHQSTSRCIQGSLGAFRDASNDNQNRIRLTNAEVNQINNRSDDDQLKSIRMSSLDCQSNSIDVERRLGNEDAKVLKRVSNQMLSTLYSRALRLISLVLSISLFSRLVNLVRRINETKATRVNSPFNLNVININCLKPNQFNISSLSHVNRFVNTLRTMTSQSIRVCLNLLNASRTGEQATTTATTTDHQFKMNHHHKLSSSKPFIKFRYLSGQFLKQLFVFVLLIAVASADYSSSTNYNLNNINGFNAYQLNNNNINGARHSSITSATKRSNLLNGRKLDAIYFEDLNNEQFGHLAIDPLNNDIYIGAVNRLYQLNSNLQVKQLAKMGPQLDSPECPGIKNCPQIEKKLTNYYNKVLLVDKRNHRLISCGTLFQVSFFLKKLF